MAADNKLVPLRMSDFGLGQHAYQIHNATVPPSTTKEDLESPTFWGLVKTKLRTHDEIRVVAEDSTFLAKVLVTAADGMSVMTKVIYHIDIDPVDEDAMASSQSRYFVKMRGRQAWCVVDRETGDNVIANISKQSQAQKELEQYLQAQAA